MFLENLLKKNFLDDPKNVEWYETTLYDILSIELASNDGDLKSTLLKSTSFFKHRSYEDLGNVFFRFCLIFFKLKNFFIIADRA